MIVVRLQGGFSNQLFQYAVGRRLAMLRNTKLMLDTTWYDEADQTDGVGVREYEIHPLSIKADLYHPTLGNRVLLKLHKSSVYNDEHDPYNFHKEVLDLPDFSRLFGFFQNEKYFKDIREILLEEFTLKEPATGKNKKLLAEIEANPSSTSVHVRRGDYVYSPSHNKMHGAMGSAYYKKAIKELQKKVKNPTAYVISDDPKWCKDNIDLSVPTVFVDNNTYGGEDMRLIRACKHNIMANSSFSWWGAWLNENPDKIVIAPKNWLASNSLDTSDFIPKEWTRL